MKKIINLVLASTMVFALASCNGETATTSTTGTETTAETTTSVETEVTEETETTEDVAEEKPETITIKSFNANKEVVDLEVPYDPQRIAILDMAALDIIDSIGVGDRVVGTAGTSIEYLQQYITDDITNLGTIKEADLEATMAAEPDIIFIGGRLSASYDALSEIAPVVFLGTDVEKGVVASTEENATIIASIFGLEDKIASKMDEYDSRITALQEVATEKTALVGMTTSGSFNLLGNDGRCSIISVEIGFDNLAAADTEDTAHGEESSFEVIVDKNPDYIFVMDRDSAINTEGAQTAQEIMENELVMQSSAYQNNQIIYLAHPNVWYTGEGGINALDIMLQDLEEGLLK